MAAYTVILPAYEPVLVWGYGGTGDSTAPVLTVVSPTAGSTISASQSITFDITDETALSLVLIYVKMGSFSEVVYDDGFLTPYTNSSRTAISNGHRYVIRRSTNWLSSPSFVVRSVDESGNTI